jgi:exonuclease VII small subunit
MRGEALRSAWPTPACPCCCSAGEEVSICYGTFPNEVFLLLFGFVPEDNPHDSVALYSGGDELLQHCQEFAQLQAPGLIAGERWQAAAGLLAGRAGLEGAAAHEGGGATEGGEQAAEAWQQQRPQQQLAITGQGFAPELLQAFQEAAAALQSAGVPLEAVQAALPVGLLMADRCSQLLLQFPSTLQEDLVLLGAAEGAGLSANMQLALRYRLNKKQVLQFAADALRR